MNEKDMLHQFDHAKLGRFHFILVILSGLCWALVAYGVTIIGFLLPSLRADWGTSSSLLGIIAGAGLVGMFIGSTIGGTLADRLGRRRVLTWALVFSGGFFLLSALSWNYASLLVLRLFTGMGLGAVIPIVSTLVTEYSPSRVRGTLSIVINACWGLGGTLAALVGYSIVLDHGWRVAMYMGGFAFFLAVLVRFLLPESTRFLISRGRVAEAQKQFSAIHLDLVQTNPSEESAPFPTSSGASASGGIWSSAFARITFSLWFLWAGLNFLYQGVLVWLPTMLASTHITEGRSFLLTLLISIGQIPGSLIVAFLVDRTHRRGLLLISLVLLTAATFLLGLSQNDTWILVTGFLLMIFNGMAWGMAFSVSSELYPTRIRGAATGWATGVGRLGGAAAPMLVGLVLEKGGNLTIVFALLALAPFLAAVIISTLKMDTTGKALETISAG